MKLNLGCGYNNIEGFEGLDNDKRYNPLHLHDLEKRIGLNIAAPGTVSHIKAFHVLEHIKNLEQLVLSIHSILDTGGLFEIIVPTYDCRASIADITHVRQFTPESFLMWTDPRYFQPGNYRPLQGLFIFEKETQEMVFKQTHETVATAGSFHKEYRLTLKKVNMGYWRMLKIHENLVVMPYGCFYDGTKLINNFCTKCETQYTRKVD